MYFVILYTEDWRADQYRWKDDGVHKLLLVLACCRTDEHINFNNLSHVNKLQLCIYI